MALAVLHKLAGWKASDAGAVATTELTGWEM